MSYIVFAWTTPALLAGHKTVTRREWSYRHALQFHAGQLVDAWGANPRNQGRRVATIRLIADPVRESLADFPEADFEAEGFAWLAAQFPADPYHAGVPEWFQDLGPQMVRARALDQIRADGRTLWVVRFELVEVLV